MLLICSLSLVFLVNSWLDPDYIKNCERSEILSFLQTNRSVCSVPWILAEDTRVLGQRQKTVITTTVPIISASVLLLEPQFLQSDPKKNFRSSSGGSNVLSVLRTTALEA